MAAIGPFDFDRNRRSDSPSVVDANKAGSGLGVLLKGPGPSVKENTVVGPKPRPVSTEASLRVSAASTSSPRLLGEGELRLGYGLESEVMFSSGYPAQEVLDDSWWSIVEVGSPFPVPTAV